MERYLVVDDSPTARAAIAGYIRALRPRSVVHEAHDANDAYKACELSHYDVVFLDMLLGGGHNGLDVLRALRSQHYPARIVLISKLSPMDPNISAATKEGIDAYLPKPVTMDDVRAVIGA